MAATNDQPPGTPLPPPEAAETEPKPARCRYCREPMFAGATKCNKCGGFQNWRRFFDLSSVFLSLLIALIGVSSAVLPALTEVVTPTSDLVIRAHHCERDAISLLVENRGSKPGIVGNFEMTGYCRGIRFDPEAATDGKPYWGIYTILGTDGATSRIVPPRSSVQIRFPVGPDFLKRARDKFPGWERVTPADIAHFYAKLNDGSIRVSFKVELLNYGVLSPSIVKISSQDSAEFDPRTGQRVGDDESFWRYFLTLGGYSLSN